MKLGRPKAHFRNEHSDLKRLDPFEDFRGAAYVTGEAYKRPLRPSVEDDPARAAYINELLERRYLRGKQTSVASECLYEQDSLSEPDGSRSFSSQPEEEDRLVRCADLLV